MKADSNSPPVLGSLNSPLCRWGRPKTTWYVNLMQPGKPHRSSHVSNIEAFQRAPTFVTQKSNPLLAD